MKIKALSELRTLVPPTSKPTTTGPYRLMISHNLGAEYREEYKTEDFDDPVLHDKIDIAEKLCLCYYVEGAKNVICSIHKAAIAHLK
jgi:hypothetical protein